MTVSIAMTTYNGSKYIVELMDSILAQTVQPDEVVLVDDCSSDGTYELVNNYIRDHQLKSWHNYKNEVNFGWRANFREAFKRCKGDLIFLCDQDDIWMPYKIEEMKSVMEENPGIQLLISNYAVMDIDREEKVQIAGLNRDDGSLEHPKFQSSSLTVMRPGCTYCARKSLVDQLWERDMITAPHDAMLWGYAAIDETLYLYNRKTIQFRRHSESASTPTKSLCLTRRLGEVAYDVDVETFFLEACKNRGYVRRGKLIESQLTFNTMRKKILEEKSLIKMIFFQIKNRKHYATLRNMLSDDYVLLLKRN
jgi:glycosyltransferase involved in cell wall biosynthesis